MTVVTPRAASTTVMATLRCGAATQSAARVPAVLTMIEAVVMHMRGFLTVDMPYRMWFVLPRPEPVLDRVGWMYAKLLASCGFVGGDEVQGVWT
jgi:hypothetical protein